MNREVHVRFWESPEVKVLRATRQKRRFRCESVNSGSHLTPDLSPRRDSLRQVPRGDMTASPRHVCLAISRVTPDRGRP